MGCNGRITNKQTLQVYIMFLLVMTPFRLVGCYAFLLEFIASTLKLNAFYLEDHGRMSLWNFGIHVQKKRCYNPEVNNMNLIVAA
jgi:hypothetical protein